MMATFEEDDGTVAAKCPFDGLVLGEIHIICVRAVMEDIKAV